MAARTRPGSCQLLVCLAGLAVLGVASVVRLAVRPAEPDLRLSVDGAFHHFGKVQQGQALRHQFRLRNDTPVPLELVQVQSTCRCTTATEVRGRVVEPGRAVDVPVTLKTGAGDGEVTGSVILFYRPVGRKAAALAYQDLTVRADVAPDFRVRPTLVDFGVVDDARPVRRVIRLRPNLMPDVRVTDVYSPHEAFSARLVPAPEGSGDIHVEVTFCGKGLWQAGAVSSLVYLKTTSPRLPQTDVLARAVFQAPVEVRPAAVVIGSDVAGPAEREVLVTTAWPAEVAGLRSPVAAVRLSRTSAPGGREHRVTVTVDEAAGRAALNTEIAIDLRPVTAAKDAEARTVTVPVHRLAPEERTTE